MKLKSTLKKIGFITILKITVSCGAPTIKQIKKNRVGIIIGNNTMKPVGNSNDLPKKYKALFGAIGKMTGNCTVFHIGKGVVATAGHCISLVESNSHRRPCQKISIEWGLLEEGQPKSTSKCIEILDHKLAGGLDYALIKVDPIPESSININTEIKAADNRAITIFGHPQGRPLEWSGICELLNPELSDSSQYQFSHQCDTLGGNSGSPILDEETLSVIGVHNGGHDEANYGTFLKHMGLERTIGWMPGHGPESGWDGKSDLEFGPFENNEDRLLASIPTSQGSSASFTLKYDIEKIYDKLLLADGSGRIIELDGKGEKSFSDLPTPITVAFKSDYAGNSQLVSLESLSFKK